MIINKKISLESLAAIKEKIKAFASLLDQETNLKEMYKERKISDKNSKNTGTETRD